MANHKSAAKRARQAENRKILNRRNRGRLRTAIKNLRAALASGDQASAQSLLPRTVSLIDKSTQKGVLHQNAAARHKARLTTSVNAISKASS
jgi:small subunit ribosomal protein S20